MSLGLLFSGPVMSMSIMLLGANWFAEGNYKQRLNSFLHNKAALLVSSVFFMHALGLLWSSDLHYGWDDVRTKIPLFALPFILSTSTPLSRAHFHLLLGFFAAGVVVSTLISVTALLGLLPVEIHDIRDISLFVSHIRLSLMICLAVFIFSYFFARNHSLSARILFSLLIVWLIIFMAILESLTGLSILFVVSAIAGIYYFQSKKSYWSKIVFGIATVLLIGTGIQVYRIAKTFVKIKPIDPSHLEKITASGNFYENDMGNLVVENGIYANTQVC
ncbi:MAG TPA: hypothetical protein VGO45_00715, partial [Bacteroidia bacterium]|nr:hypothetical protein [Bacteroidia bacterium]